MMTLLKKVAAFSRCACSGAPLLATLALLTSVGCADGPDADAPQPQAEAGEGARSMFNGVDLTDWDGDPRFWSVQNGVIVAETTAENPTEGNTFLIWTGGEPANFEMTLELRSVLVGDSAVGNTGVQIRSVRYTDPENPNLKWRVRGYQPDFAVGCMNPRPEGCDWIPGILHSEGGLGTRVYRGQRVYQDSADVAHVVDTFADPDSLFQYIHPHTEWNSYRIYANGDTIRSWLNGHLMHELVDQGPRARRDGVIAFQMHAGPPQRFEFRNIYLTEF